MKKTLCIILGIMVLFALIGCSSSTAEESPENFAVGVWVLSTDNSVTAEFKADGTMITTQSDGSTNEYTYEVSDDKVLTYYQDGTEMVTYTHHDNQLETPSGIILEKK